MSYRETERRFFKWSYDLRAKLYGPLISFLAKNKVSANQVTYFRALIFVLGVMYPLFVRGQVVTAVLIYFFGFMFLDTIDGQLARQTSTATDRGKFTDLFTDLMGYSLLVMGLAYVEAVNPFIMFYQVIIHGGLYVMACVYKNEKTPSDWLIRAEPNLTYFKIIANSAIAILIVFRVNIMDPIFILLNVWMSITLFYYFVRFQSVKLK